MSTGKVVLAVAQSGPTSRSAPGVSLAREPTDEADRGRHTGFARHEGLAGGPGSLSLSFGGGGR